MMTRKNKAAETWPRVTVGSHSTRTEYEDGRVEFVTDWEALKRDVREAIAEFERSQAVKQSSQDLQPTAPKRSRKKTLK